MLPAPRSLSVGGGVQRFVLEQGTVKDLEAISLFMEEVCAAHAIEGRTAYHLQLAVDEACANIFEHGYMSEPGRVEIDAAYTPPLLTIHIWDWGQEFDPDAVPPPDPTVPLAMRPIGGLGIHIIRQVIDRVEYHFDAQHGNCLTLEKAV